MTRPKAFPKTKDIGDFEKYVNLQEYKECFVAFSDKEQEAKDLRNKLDKIVKAHDDCDQEVWNKDTFTRDELREFTTKIREALDEVRGVTN